MTRLRWEPLEWYPPVRQHFCWRGLCLMLAGRDQVARCQAETLRLCVVIAMMAIYALVRIGELEAPSSASLSFYCTQRLSWFLFAVSWRMWQDTWWDGTRWDAEMKTTSWQRFDHWNNPSIPTPGGTWAQPWWPWRPWSWPWALRQTNGGDFKIVFWCCWMGFNCFCLMFHCC